MNTESEIIAHYVSMDLDTESQMYLHTHAMRFAYLSSMVRKVRDNFNQNSIRIMDIGPSFFTDMLMKNFQDDHIYTLGFSHEASRGGHFPESIRINKDHFYAFDLNDTQFPEQWITPPTMDIVVMGEVLEHLYTSPVHVFRFMSSILNPGGYLIVGTPNATAIQRRMELLFGRHPYEMIRETRDNPGHFREYTVTELKELGELAGLEVVDYEVKNYFKRNTSVGTLFDKLVGFLLPANFNSGINIVYRKPSLRSG